LICEKALYPELQECEVCVVARRLSISTLTHYLRFKKLDETVRGEGGFGSTGINKIIENESKKAKLGV
jgi:hypothetical protein